MSSSKHVAFGWCFRLLKFCILGYRVHKYGNIKKECVDFGRELQMPNAPAAFPTKLLLTLESVGGRYQCLHEKCLKSETSSMDMFHSHF